MIWAFGGIFDVERYLVGNGRVVEVGTGMQIDLEALKHGKDLYATWEPKAMRRMR